MIRSTVKTFNLLPETSKAIQDAARDGINAAARKAAAVAQENASIGLDITVIPARSTGTGYSGGIRSRRSSDTPGKTTPIAIFFDKGTLGGRRGKLKPRGRKQHWTDKNGRSYHRDTIDPASGIEAERFFLKARIEGRRTLVEQITRGFL